MVVAERAGDGGSSGEILLDEGTDDITLEALLMVDDVVGDVEVLGDAAGVIHVVDGAAAAEHLLGHALLAGEAALVPELHGQADELVAFRLEHGGDGRGVDSAGHGYRNRVVDLLLHSFSLSPTQANRWLEWDTAGFSGDTPSPLPFSAKFRALFGFGADARQIPERN